MTDKTEEIPDRYKQVFPESEEELFAFLNGAARAQIAECVSMEEGVAAVRRRCFGSESAMQSITVELEANEKDAFAEMCENCGMTPGEAIRLFVSVSVVRGEFPFDLENPYGFNEETLAAIRSVENEENLIGPFNSVEELLAYLEDDQAV